MYIYESASVPLCRLLFHPVDEKECCCSLVAVEAKLAGFFNISAKTGVTDSRPSLPSPPLPSELLAFSGGARQGWVYLRGETSEAVKQPAVMVRLLH